MSLTAWNEDIPSDNNLAGEGNDEIASLKARVKERLELDHQFSGELDPLEGDCDGYHKKVTLQKLSEDPTPLTGTGVLYTKEVDGIIELFFVDEVSGIVNQLTEQGVLSLNTLQNDIDGNQYSLRNMKLWIPDGTDGVIVNSSAAYNKNFSAKGMIQLKVSASGQNVIYPDVEVPASLITIMPGDVNIIFGYTQSQWTTTNSNNITYYYRKSVINVKINTAGFNIYDKDYYAKAVKSNSYPAYPAYPVPTIEIIKSWPIGSSLAEVLPEIE